MKPTRPPRPRLPGLPPARWLALAAVSGGAGVACSAGLAADDIIGTGWPALEVIGVWWAVYAVGLAAVLRGPRRAGLVVIVVVAVGLRAAALTGGPALSDDLYRYAWDGRVQAHGVDPYRYPPLAPELDRLHDSWLWPSPAKCAAIHRPPGCTRLGRPAARTIYPPLAEAWFALLHAVAPRAHEDGPRLAALLVDLALLVALIACLRASGRDPRWVAIYAWSPLGVIETVQNGHVDGLAALLAVVAVWLARSRPARSALVVAAAALVKLYPAVLAAMLCTDRRRTARTVAIGLGATALAYAPHVLAVGPRVLGYLPQYLQEEQYTRGGRFQLLALLGFSGTAAQVTAALVAAAALVWIVRTAIPERPEISARRVLGTLLLVATPVQPWYALPLLAIAALDGAWWWAAVGAAAYPLYFSEVLNGPSALVGRLGYGLAAVVILAVAAVRSRRGGGSSAPRARRSPPGTLRRSRPRTPVDSG